MVTITVIVCWCTPHVDVLCSKVMFQFTIIYDYMIMYYCWRFPLRWDLQPPSSDYFLNQLFLSRIITHHYTIISFNQTLFRSSIFRQCRDVFGTCGEWSLQMVIGIVEIWIMMSCRSPSWGSSRPEITPLNMNYTPAKSRWNPQKNRPIEMRIIIWTIYLHFFGGPRFQQFMFPGF